MNLLEGFCMKHGREKIDIHGIQYIEGNKLETQKIIAKALKTIDLLNNIRIYSEKEYLHKAKEHTKFMSIHINLVVLCRNYKNITFDFHMSPEEKLTCLENSIYLAKENLLEIKQRDEIPNQVQTRCDNMFKNCYNKLESNDSLHIINLLEKIGANFIIKFDDNYIFYPFISDILIDTVSFEYSKELNKGLVDLIKPKIHIPSIILDVLQTSGYKFLSKIYFIREIGRKSNHLYLLHEYTRKFNCDLSTMRELYKEILYENPKNHPTALKSNKFFIKNIKPREFILSQSKMVIDFAEIPNKIHIDTTSKSPFLMIPSFQGNLITE